MSEAAATKAKRYKSALQIACLTASLATGFVPAAAHAETSATFSATSEGQSTQISDAYVLNSSPVLSTSVVSDSPPTTTINANPFVDPVTQVTSSTIAPLGGSFGMVVFADSANMIAGQSFNSEFLPARPYDESQVVNYIDYASQGLTDPNTTDQNAYTAFLNNLYNNDYQAKVQNTGTINAYEFTNGQFIGIINTAQLPPVTQPYTGFGLVSQTAVPEASPLTMLLMGGVLLGFTVARRRKSCAASK